MSHILFTLQSLLFTYQHGAHRDLHPFPTRRSSDLTPSATWKTRAAAACSSETSSNASRRRPADGPIFQGSPKIWTRSEEHTSELQSPCNLVCRLLLEKKKERGLLSKHDAVQRLLCK